MKLFKSGLIYDGTASEPFKGDILVENDKIIRVSECIQPQEAWEVIDLDGFSVFSGFIDAHSHNDWFAIKKDTSKYFEPFIRQGITSFITGNCGLSAVGFEPQTQHIDGLGAYAFCWKALSQDAEFGVGGINRSVGLNIRPVKDEETDSEN